MQGINLQESALQRGWNDTKHQHSGFLFWMVEAMISSAMAYYTENPLAFPATIGVLIVIVLVWNVGISPTKQRNEARVEINNLKSPPALSIRLKHVAKDLRLFRSEYRHDLPHPNDALSYFSPGLDSAVSVGRGANVKIGSIIASGPNDDPDHLNAALDRQAERKNYNQKWHNAFGNEYAGQFFQWLNKAVALGCIDKESVDGLREKMDRSKEYFFEDFLDLAINTAGEVSSALKDIEK